MAQSFNIAIELKCEVGKVVWSVVRARPSSWRSSEPLPSLGLTVTAPREYVGEKLYLGNERLPHQLRRELLTGDRRLSASSRKQEFELIMGNSTKDDGGFQSVNPWTLRGEFLALDPKKVGIHGLVGFLNRCGQWSTSISVHRGYKRLFKPEGFWRDRDKLISEMNAGTSRWDDPTFFSGFGLRRRSQFPHLVHIDQYCFDAILHSVTFDLMRGVKFGLCAREDCRRPFPIESRHRRIYCDQYCGHLVSLRIRRSEGGAKPKVSKRRVEVNHVAL
jgi:hypothetical protein